MEHMKGKLLSLISDIREGKLDYIDEAATKQVIIQRVLGLLGWDLYNYNEVCPEYSLGGGRVDYALLDQCRVKVFIEVKKISEDLNRHQGQLLNYSFKQGVSLAVLTNGIYWWFYLPLSEGSWERRKFYEVSFQEQEVDEIVSRLEQLLSKDNVLTGTAVGNAKSIIIERERDNLIQKTLPAVVEQVLTQPHELLVELVAEITEEVCGYKPDFSMVKLSLLNRCNKEIIQTQKPSIEAERKPREAFGNAGKIPIGEFVRDALFHMLRGSSLPEDMIMNLQDEAYCKGAFRLNYPLLRKVITTRSQREQRFIGKYARYYAKEVIINNEPYLVTNHWVEEISRKPLRDWLLKNGFNALAEKLDE